MLQEEIILIRDMNIIMCIEIIYNKYCNIPYKRKRKKMVYFEFMLTLLKIACVCFSD